MADYKLNRTGGVIRSRDGAEIPDDNRNRDWRKYQVWVSQGNTPDAADPEPARDPTVEDRLQALEVRAGIR